MRNALFSLFLVLALAACGDSTTADAPASDVITDGPDAVNNDEDTSAPDAGGEDTICVPDCENKVCGDDGCGGECGACDDGIDCTVDSCKEDGSICVVDSAACDCAEDADCDDGNPCTTGTCSDDFACVVDGLADGTPCGDTEGDTCYELACIAPPVCGDSEVTGAETCDDGNAGTEACEYGVESCEVCDENCQLIEGDTTFCGDGFADEDNGEVCDDGNVDENDYCAADCTAVTGECGDGTVQTNEDCDDGGFEPGDGCDANCAEENFEIGDVIINEVLASPSGLDNEREWFEVYNTTNEDIDVNGWRVFDGNASTDYDEITGDCADKLDSEPCGDGGGCMGGNCVASCTEGDENHACGDEFTCMVMPPIPGTETVAGVCYRACAETADCDEASVCMAGVCKTGVHRITHEEAVVVPADGYKVFTLNCDPATNGGIEGAYCYETTLGPMNPQFVLNNDTDSLTIRWHNTTIDSVSWSDGDITTGASWSLSSNTMDGESNDDPTNWCSGTGEYFADDTTSELGTPGEANSTCE